MPERGVRTRMALFGKKESVTLRITGMHCANCQKAVGDALRGVPGVVTANVDLAFHRANVTFDASQADITKMVAAIEASGYKAAPLA